MTTVPEAMRALFRYKDRPIFPPRQYVAPTDPVAIVRLVNGERRFALVRWGLVPSWAKEVKRSKPLINARSETILEKPSFRTAVMRRRCLVPASGFYEWMGDVPGKKQAYFVERNDGEPFAMAGIWEHWMDAGGSELESVAIITTNANETLRPIYHRMPAIIAEPDFSTWLDNDSVDAREATKLLNPAPEAWLSANPVKFERKPKPKTDADRSDQISLL